MIMVLGKLTSRSWIKYVGVIWFVFHVLQLLLIRLHNQTYLVALENLQ